MTMDAMEVGAGIMGLTRGCFCKPTMKNIGKVDIAILSRLRTRSYRNHAILGVLRR